MDHEEYTPLKLPSSEIQKHEKEDKPDSSKNLNLFIIIVTSILIL